VQGPDELSTAEGAPPWPPFLAALLPPVVLALLVAAVWVPIARHAFVLWDDHSFIFANADLRPPTLHRLGQYWHSAPGEIFVPLTHSVWTAVAAVAYRGPAADGPGVLDPMPFHVASIAGHALAALAAMSILRRLGGSAWAALAGAMLWALHPLQVETVAWASALKDVLAGLLSLVAIRLYLAHLDAQREHRHQSAMAYYVWATLVFVLATLAKPTAVVLPAVAFVLAWLWMRRPALAALRGVVPWIVVAIPATVLALENQPALGVPDVPWIARPVVALDAIAFYMVKLVAPTPLAIDYGRTPAQLLSGWQAYVTWLLPVVLGVACWRLRGRIAWPIVALALFIIPLAPVLGFVPFSFQRYSTVADHYVYLSLLGPALAVAMVTARWPRTAGAACAVGIVAMGVLTRMQTRHWLDTGALMQRAMDVNPQNPVAREYLAIGALRRGDWAAADEHLRLAIRSGDVRWLLIRGEALVALGRLDEARQSFEAWRHRPDYAGIARGPDPPRLLEYLRALDPGPGATTRRAELAQRRPWTAEMLWIDAQTRMALGDHDGAMASYRAALRDDPDDPTIQESLARARRLGATTQRSG